MPNIHEEKHDLQKLELSSYIFSTFMQFLIVSFLSFEKIFYQKLIPLRKKYFLRIST